MSKSMTIKINTLKCLQLVLQNHDKHQMLVVDAWANSRTCNFQIPALAKLNVKYVIFRDFEQETTSSFFISFSLSVLSSPVNYTGLHLQTNPPSSPFNYLSLSAVTIKHRWAAFCTPGSCRNMACQDSSYFGARRLLDIHSYKQMKTILN